MTDRSRTVVRAGMPAIVTDAELRRDVFGLRNRVPEGGVAVITARHAPAVAAALVALEGWASHIYLSDERASTVAVPDSAVSLDDAVVLDDVDVVVDRRSHEARLPRPRVCSTQWRLYSSGTTGRPTPTDHLLTSLAASARRASQRRTGDEQPRRWGLLYQPTRMAGLQVILQALVGGDEVVDATHLEGIGAQVDFFLEQGVDALSATPTMWRRILQVGSSADLRLKQVTLGGEIATQPLLDTLCAAFDARVTHVYASTEAGAAFAVSDGEEGFPRSLLHVGAAPALQVRAGVLYVRAAGTSATEPDGFVCTDDLVEVRGDRVHFLGRASGLVNIGGEKVAPELVESILRLHPDVVDAVVIARRNSFSGSLLTAQIVVRDHPAAVADALPAAIRAWVAQRLSRSHVPARIDVVAKLTTTATGKVLRT